uniref:Uncharacterized protein n=1 Tax=Candidatus Kentrum sp. LPFa TaxID=2126335 RepID=A0A450XFN0_9GAMM|nr:MAG: hypothetical protein BECKLPF1236A_GA0070988_101497 [Candidatus Kentron sp. LPFa]VFK28103.1 MAG: hypothetical protein BECKLPF1236C_GA0070990_1005811 [Candidatus Kentron sp. LPFa]
MWGGCAFTYLPPNPAKPESRISVYFFSVIPLISGNPVINIILDISYHPFYLIPTFPVGMTEEVLPKKDRENHIFLDPLLCRARDGLCKVFKKIS